MKRRFLALAVMMPVASASAAEIQFEAFYRARARVYDTLSLKRGVDQGEGTTWVVQNRMWVRPKFFITDNVALFADVLALQNVAWGSQQNPWFDEFSLPQAAILRVEDMAPNTDDLDAKLPPVQLWRAWSEFRTKIGTFKVGRQPLHWGLGIWRNDGMGDQAEYGDTSDRVSWEHIVQDVWLTAAFNLNTSGFIQKSDEIWSVDVGGAYRTERVNGGVLFNYRHSNGDQTKFDLFTVDGSVDMSLGFIGLDAEAVFQFGNGDLGNGVNNIRQFGAGFVADVSANFDRVQVHVEGGMATGDKDPSDARLGTFMFDRDYNLGLFLFEQPMPVLTATTPGEQRDFSAVQTANSVSNAGYVRPRVTFRAVPGFFIDAQAIAAWAVAVTPDQVLANRKGPYGVEVDATLRYQAIEHLEIGGTAAVFVPGKFYGNLVSDTLTGFNAVSGGGQFWARVRF